MKGGDYIGIDEVDVKILMTLLRNPRTGFVEIANELKISANTIRSRFERLKRTGVITGAIMQINPKSLGYNCIANLMIRTDYKEDKKILEFLETIPNIISFHTQLGKYNLVCFAALKTTDELAHMIEQLSRHPNIMKVSSNIWVDVINMDHPENLLIPQDSRNQSGTNPKWVRPELFKENNSVPDLKLDKTDITIMKLISENARMSFRKISSQMGLSTLAIIKRYNRLRKDVLTFASITIDLGKIGYIGNAFFGIKVSNKNMVSIVLKKIVQIPNIIVAYRVLGEIDLIVGVPFSNMEQLTNQYNNITKTPGVIEVELFLHKPFPNWPLNLFSKLISI